jgi:hypothetical protein
MKKFIVISLVSILVLAFGGTVYAQEKAPVLEFKASGFLDVITEYNRNVVQALPGSRLADVLFGPASYLVPTGTSVEKAFNKKQSWMESRGRLRFDAIMGKEMMGTFLFEIDSLRWGERAPNTNDQRNYAGHWGVADRGAVEVKNMFITFGVPVVPVPITVQAGIHPMYIRPEMFLATEGPGVTAAVKIDPVTIKLMWFKALENEIYAADDVDFYGIEANAKIQTLTIGGYAVNVNSNTYPQTYATKISGATILPGTDETSTVDYQANMWWFGLYADGKVGPVNLNLDFALDHGKIVDHRNIADRARDVKFDGWQFIGKVSYPIEKLNVGAQFIYGSGADLKKTSANGLPGSIVANDASGTVTSSKVGIFVIPQGSEGSNFHSLIIDGNGVLNRGNSGYQPAAGDYMVRAATGGLWFAKLFGSYQVLPTLKTTLEAYYVGDTTKNGNTIGNAVRSDGTPRNDKSVGFEFDLINELQIYKNLVWNFGGGYLIAGNAMDLRVGATNTNKSPRDPWAIQTRLIYSF